MAKTEAVEMKVLGRTDILNAKDLDRQSVEVPEWGGLVFVRGMTGGERAEFDGGITTAKSRVRAGEGKEASFDIDVHAHKMRMKVCVWCIVDSDGKQLFKDRDILALSEKSDAALQRVYDRAIELSGLAAEAEDEAEDFSESDPEDAS